MKTTIEDIKNKFLNEFCEYGNPDATFEWFKPYLTEINNLKFTNNVLEAQVKGLGETIEVLTSANENKIDIQSDKDYSKR